MNVSSHYSKFLLIIYIVATLVLAYSVATSGLSYQYDSDELSQSGITYLIAHGFVPYISFWWPYSPLFNFFLLPLFTLFGFTFDTIYLARILMAVLFFLRIVISMAILRLISSRISAYIVCALILLDPFTTFSGMQIRQDNFMMTVYLLGLYIFVRGFLAKSNRLLFIAGITLATSLLSLIKIAPSIFALGIIFFLWSVYVKTLRSFFVFLGGALGAISIYFLFALVSGTFFQMVQQTIIDPYTFQSNVLYPTHASFFYRPDNTFIYGVGGKPLSWRFVHILPIMAVVGLIVACIKRPIRPYLTRKRVLYIMLATALVVHWLLLFHVQSAYMQYHLPVQWYFAFFGAITISAIIETFQKYASKFKVVGYIVVLILFSIFVQASVVGNIARSKIDLHWTVEAFEKVWQEIPADAYVFPDFLFRKIPYPLTNQDIAGNAFAPTLLARYGPIRIALENKKVEYLYLSDYTMSFIPMEDQKYIREHYIHKHDEIYMRNDL